MMKLKVAGDTSPSSASGARRSAAMPGRLKFATASLPLGNLLKAAEAYEGQNLHDPVATNVEDLLARIGYGKTRGAGSYAADYTQKLKDNGFETLSQLQFVTLDGLHQAGIKPGHATSRCKNACHQAKMMDPGERYELVCRSNRGM